MKRLCDIIVSIIALIICFVPMLLIGIAVKLDSTGPLLFKQQRIGKNGVLFEIYKFRTMRTDTPNVSTEALGDPSKYITSIGKLLRKSSLDELPQLFNILKGDMSLIGPRPALYNQYQLISMREEVGVNCIRPGLTGYAQVTGRDFISDETKVMYDLYYLKNRSFLLDVKIIWKTIFSIIKAEGVKIS